MLKYLLEKEFKQFFRNKFLVVIITLFPFFMLLIFPLVANLDVKNVNISVVDNDKSSYSRELIGKIESSGYFRITDASNIYNDALMTLESDESDIIIEIPSNFEKKLVTDKQAELMITANAVNGLKGGLGSSYLSFIVNEFSSEVRIKLMQYSNELITPSIEAIPLYRYNPKLDYKIFMIPAIIVMLLAILGGFLPCLNIVTEKENGTIEQMNVTPVGKFNIILSKLMPYWLFGFVVLTICIIVSHFVYGLAPKGSIIVLYIFVSVFIFAFSGLGLIISNYAKSAQQAMFMMFFFIMTFIFMSGLYTPVENMPGWVQIFSHFSPLKYTIEVFRMIFLKGSRFIDMLPQFFALCGFAVFFNVWAVLSYHKTE